MTADPACCFVDDVYRRDLNCAAQSIGISAAPKFKEPVVAARTTAQSSSNGSRGNSASAAARSSAISYKVDDSEGGSQWKDEELDLSD